MSAISAVGIAEHAQRLRHRVVDDLEVAAAGELLELHQREVRLDAGRVAIHHEADRAGRRDHGRLRIAIAVLLAERERAVPGEPRALDQARIRAGGVVERHRRDRERLVAGLLAMGRAAMVADHPQHGVAVLLVAREGAELRPPSPPRSHRPMPVMIAESAPQIARPASES